MSFKRQATSLEAIIVELCTLVDKEQRRIPASASSVQRARELGERLDEMGGFELMQRVMQAVIKRRPFGYELVNSWWDGIGSLC
jgi:hypothetical protein